MSEERLKKAFLSIVELTQDPMGPIKVQNAYDHVEALGALMATCAKREQVLALNQRLLADFEDPEINELCKTPEYIMAVAGLLSVALVHFGLSHM